MKTAQKKNGSGRNPEPNTQPTLAGPAHPLAGRSWTIEVEHSRLQGSETNPRKEFDEGALRELAESLKANGQLQAILVRVCPKWARGAARNSRLPLTQQRALDLLSGAITPDSERPETLVVAEDICKGQLNPVYEIVAGERRWRAAGPKFAGLKRVLVTVRCLSDEQVIEAQYVENLQRRDLSALEEAEGYAVLIRSGKYTAETLAEKLGKGRSYVFDRVKLVNLEGSAREALKEGRISPTLAAVVASVPGKANQARVMKDIVFDYDDMPRPVADVKAEIEEELMRPLKEAPWKLEEVFTYKGAIAGACAGCPQMTRNMTAENPELAKGPARCMGLECFEKRTAAAGERLKAEYAAKGKEFWNASQARNRRHAREYCWEGDLNYDADPPYAKWEKVCKGIEAPIIAEAPYENGLKRIWRRADLEKAGVLKVKPNETVEAKKAARKEELRDEKVFEKMKELALHDLGEKIFKRSAFSAELHGPLPKLMGALVKDYVYHCEYSWFERDGHNGRDKITRQGISDEVAMERFAKGIIEDWDDMKTPPACLAEVGIFVSNLEERARQELRLMKEKLKRPAKSDQPEIRNGKSAMGDLLDRAAGMLGRGPESIAVGKLAPGAAVRKDAVVV